MHKSARWGLGWKRDLFMSVRKPHPHFPMIRDTIQQSATEVHKCKGILWLIPFIPLGLQQLFSELHLMFLNCEAAGSWLGIDCTYPWGDFGSRDCWCLPSLQLWAALFSSGGCDGNCKLERWAILLRGLAACPVWFCTYSTLNCAWDKEDPQHICWAEYVF